MLKKDKAELQHQLWELHGKVPSTGGGGFFTSFEEDLRRAWGVNDDDLEEPFTGKGE